MTFIITFIALVIERFFDCSHIRRFGGFLRFQKWLGLRLAKWPAYLVLTLTLVLPVLAVALINCFLTGILYGALKLIFGAIVLVYCLGPKNFWAQTYTCISALHADDPHPEFEVIKNAFGLMPTDNVEAFHRALTNALFIEANRRVFAVFFWFIVLGPAGAVLYRLVDLCRKEGVTTAAAATTVLQLLDWLPVRLLGLIFALGGHFTKVIKYWQHNVFTPPKMNDVVLAECGIAALDILELDKLPADGTAEKETIALLDRAFVIGLVILAIAVLA
jgi:AmpE protein